MESPLITHNRKFILLRPECDRSNSKWNKTEKFVCPLKACRLQFDTSELLLEHRKQGHYDRIFKCEHPGCYWDFLTKKQLDRHMILHAGKKPLACPIPGCQMKFITQFNLNSHLKQHKTKHMMTCPIEDCEQKFLSERALLLHKQLLHNVKTFQCKECSGHVIFNSFVQWQIHQRLHSVPSDNAVQSNGSTQTYPCSINDCDSKFSNQYELKLHLKKEHTAKIHCCPIEECGYSFKTKTDLERHQKTHSKEKNFTCDVVDCGKTFSRLDHLRRHEVVHQENPIFACGVEDKIVKVNPTTRKQIFPCGIDGCSRIYTSLGFLNRHIKTIHHEEEWRIYLMRRGVPKDDTGERANRQETGMQTENKEIQAPESKLSHETSEVANGLLASQESLPFHTMTPPSVVMDRTLLRQVHQHAEENRLKQREMSALETLAYVAGSVADKTDSESTVNLKDEVASPSENQFSSDIFGKLEYIQDGALSDSNIFSIIQKDLECAENVEIVSTVDTGEEADDPLADNTESAAAKSESEPSMSVLIGIDDTLSQRIDTSFQPYIMRSSYDNDETSEDSRLTQDCQSVNLNDENVEIEVQTECDLDVGMDSVSFNFGSILDHDGYVSSGSMWNISSTV